ncbi:MAG: glycosyltransferase family 2 protein [Planctomycetes bacterium]|nr:glycosyltransferase family 2 protein [Planctomycetota bacterium]
MDAKDVHAVIVHYGFDEVTRKCLASFERSWSGGRVFVVDNDPSHEFAKGEANCEVVRNPGGGGFADGANLGAKAAFSAGAEAIFVINNDAELATDPLPALLCELSKPGVGAVAPLVLSNLETKEIWSGESSTRKWFPLPRNESYGKIWSGEGRSAAVTFLSGCAILIKKMTFETLEGFDTSLFMYCEDVDFCVRASRKGFGLVFTSRTHVFHAKPSKATSFDDRFALFYTTRNVLTLAYRYNSVPMFLVFFFWFLVRWNLYMTFKNLLRGNLRNALAIWRGNLAFLLGRKGKAG